MTIKNKMKIFFSISAIILAGVSIFILKGNNIKEPDSYSIIHPQLGTIKLSISATGVVEPQNRLEIKPTINGRVDRILVKEGYKVKRGQILAWMSSEERAALIDAARSMGKKSVQYWKNAYKQIPIISPISGTVIVRNIEPGQSITTTTAVLVISDRLIVEADIDETDIGKVKCGQKAIITLDAYPDVVVKAKVSHISYESTTENNVTIYNVDIAPEKVPSIYRSGMSANIEIIQQLKEECLVLPKEMIKSDEKGKFVFITVKNSKIPERRYVKTGLSDTSNTEIIKGLLEEDKIVAKGKKKTFQLDVKSTTSTNPLISKRPKHNNGGGPKRP